jgi:hypothetical protein
VLALASWRHLADSLEDGRSLRVNHDCGSGRTLSVTREGAKLFAWCHRCNDRGNDQLIESLSVRIARLGAIREADAKLSDSALPEPRAYAVSDWPTPAKLWFYKAGLGNHDIGRLQAYYHPPSNRVVLPVEGGFWQARALAAGQLPKYMAPNVDKSGILPRYGKGESITLTEDILSAYKVGQVGEGWCLMGTNLQPNTLHAILKDGRPVNVWLDNDLPPTHQVNRGQIAAKKVLKSLRAMGVKAHNIVAPRDPKLMTYDEIKGLI